jgi:hypothetical protein
MSSYVSTITIDDNEWMEIQRKVCDTEIYVARKNEEANRLREEIHKREEELKELRAQSEKTVNSAIALLQGGFNKAVNGLFIESRESLRQQAITTESEISALKNDIKATAADTVIASNRVSKISQGFATVMDALVKQEKELAQSAKVYLQNISSLYEQIKTLHPEAFDPRGYMEVKEIISSARANIAAGRFQSSLINTQHGLLKASALLTRLIISNEKYGGEVAAASELANELKARFDQFDSSMDGGIEFEIDGEKYEYDYDINHWSEGRFEQLRAAFEAANKQLQDAKEKRVSVAQIETLKKTFEDLGKRLDRCDAAARAELLGSCKAQETAARLFDSLSDNNWELGEYGFDEDDDRKPYKMTYKDAAGNSISIVVSPGASAEKPTIFLEAFAEEESHAEIVKKNIQATLPQQGIHIEQTQQLHDCQNNPNGNSFIENTLPKATVLNEQRRRKSFGM